MSNETVLRYVAGISVGGLLASGINGFWYAWVIFAIAMLGLGFDFYLCTRRAFPPRLKTYSVTLEHQFQAITHTLVVRARDKVDAIKVALLEKPSYGRNYWIATKVVEHGDIQASADA